MSVHPTTYILAAAAVPLIIIGAGVVGIIVGVWFDWPLASWIWNQLP